MRRGRHAFFLAVFAVLLLSSFASAAGLALFVTKSFFNQNETIELFGTLFNHSSSGAVPLTSKNITLNVTNNATLIAVYNFTTDNNGSFYTNGTYHAGATAVLAPATAGNYNLTAVYNESGTLYSSVVGISVGNKTVDELLLQPSLAEYLPSQDVNVTATALRGTGAQSVRVSGVYVNGTLRYLNQTILRAFSCTTATDGTCSISFPAPAESSFVQFILEANHYEGYALFSVSPFSVSLQIKDAEGQGPKDVFSPSESGVAEVQVSVNGTIPANGSYSAALTLAYPNGTIIRTMATSALNTNNSFLNQSGFSTSALAEGTYQINTTVTGGTGLTRTQKAWIQVNSWTLSFQKASEGSGFQYGLTTLPNATLLFEAYPQTRDNGTLITGLSNNFRYELKTPLGDLVSNGTLVVFNSSCGTSGCYTFNVTAPAGIGTYVLTLSATYNSITHAQSRILAVNGLSATSSTTDSTGLSKIVFGYDEFANVNFTLQNATGVLNVTNASVVNILYENGSVMNYTYQANVSLLNSSDRILQWGWNDSSNRLMLDVPRLGGLYSIETTVNNNSVKTSTQFYSNPFDTCFSAKSSSSESAYDYVWQFKPSDTIYLQVTVTEAENTPGSNASSVASLGGFYGRGNSCSFNSNQKLAIINATINVTQAYNLETGLAETLNASASGCQPLSTQGHYLCTIKANDSTWDSGRYAVDLRTTSQDGSVTDVGKAYFEAREFFVYGYAGNWVNLPESNITLNINVYQAGDGWWSSSTGLSGTATLQRIEYLGNVGEWMSSGTSFAYNVSAHNGSTITNGAGNFNLLVSRTPDGAWPTGSYKARIQVTTSEGRTDYGDIWFEIRRWDAWAQQVDVSGTIQYRYSNAPNQRVMLYLRISKAGQYSDAGGTNLGGNVTIRIKKIESYTSNGKVELSPSEYSAPPISVTNSSPYPGPIGYTTHIMNITPTSRLPPNSYNVVLEMNSTINGSAVRQQSWGWFTIKAFHAEAQPVNLTTGAYSYSSRGKTGVGFNVTTAQDQRNSYTSGLSLAALINTTVIGLRLTRGSNAGGVYSTQTLNYPQNVTISPLSVNGTGTLNLSMVSGNFSSGWYYGEITLQDNQSNRQNAYLYFTVEPFRIQSSNQAYQVGRNANYSASFSVTDPSSGSILSNANNNYTFTRVKEIRYTGGGQTTREAVIYGSGTWNGSVQSFNFSPPNATNAWASSESGWINLEFTVRDNQDNSTQTYWAGFQVVPFFVTSTLTSSQNILSNQNATFNFTLRSSSASGFAAGNLTRIRYWDYSSSTYATANFSVEGGCTHRVAPCVVNSTAILGNGTAYTVARAVNVTPASGSWSEGYVYLEPEFTAVDDASAKVTPSSTYINIVPAIRAGNYYGVNSTNFAYQWSFAANENVTIFLSGIQNSTNANIPVNITNVEYYSGSEWRESVRTYANVTGWFVLGGLNNVAAGASAYVRVPAPASGWSSGSNYLRISLIHGTNASVSGSIKGIYVYSTG